MEFLKTRLMVAQFGNKVKSLSSHAKDANSSCISEDCEHLILEYNCSCLKKSFPNRTCHEILDSDSAIPTVLCLISAIIVFLLILEIFLIRYVTVTECSCGLCFKRAMRALSYHCSTKAHTIPKVVKLRA